jgi:hypothetical protein
MWEPRRLTTLWASAVCYKDSFTFLTLISIGLRLLSARNLTAKLKVPIRRKRPGLLLHDNCGLHVSPQVMSFLKKFGRGVLYYLPYSTHLAPAACSGY